MNILTELDELGASLEGQEDITNDGGPNTAMRVRQLLDLALPRLSALVEANKRTVSAFESLGVANSVVKTLEARRECENALVSQKDALARVVAGGET